MDFELVRGSESNEGAGVNASAPFSYTETFERLCPEYLAMGMTLFQYWDDDCTMAKYVRKGYEIKREKETFDMWLQGKYVYDAICCCSPILRAFSKATEPIPYLDKPYPLSEAQAKRNAELEEKRRFEQTRVAMMNMMNEANRKILERKETEDGRKS